VRPCRTGLEPDDRAKAWQDRATDPCYENCTGRDPVLFWARLQTLEDS
jgi:hypothetical protein